MISKALNHYYLPGMGGIKNLKHGFSTKYFGNMSLSWGGKEDVTGNREKFVKELDCPSQSSFITFHLTHSSRVAVLKDKRRGQSISDPRISLPDFDGAVTNQSGLFFLFCAADCLPIIFFDPQRGVLGVAHAGWRGLVGKIHLNVLETMIEQFGSAVHDIRIGFGPSILSCCNLQKGPFRQAGQPDWQNFICPEPSGNLYRVFLNEYCESSLLAAGVLRENIEKADFCTVDHWVEFFSETAVLRGLDRGPMGRFATVVGMVVD